jgi:hypothetical protein
LVKHLDDELQLRILQLEFLAHEQRPGADFMKPFRPKLMTKAWKGSNIILHAPKYSFFFASNKPLRSIIWSIIVQLKLKFLIFYQLS